MGVHVCDGAADIELLEHNLLNVQRSGLAPNGDDDDLTGGLEGIQNQVQCGLNGGALERDVSAMAVGQLVNLSQNVSLCGGESVVSNAGVQSLLAAQRGQLGDDDLSALSLQNCGGQQTDGASTGNQCECALFELACTLNSVVANAQGLNQCSLVQGNVVGDLVNPAALDGNLLGQTATATCQADEVHVLGQVVVLGVGAGVDVITNDVGLNNNVVANLQVVYAFAQCLNNTGEFVTEGDGGVLTRNGVGVTVLGAEDGAVEVFVQVGTANTAPGDLDQNLARSGFGCGDVFNADVVTVVEACCLHGMELLSVVVALTAVCACRYGSHPWVCHGVGRGPNDMVWTGCELSCRHSHR